MSVRLGAACLLAACAVPLAGCGGAGGPASALTGRSISLDELSHSASTSAGASSGRFSFDVRADLGGAQVPLTLSGEGAFDRTAGRSSFSVDMSSFAKLLGGFVSAFGGASAKDAPSFDDPAGWKIDVVQDGSIGYVRFPAVAKQLPEGTSWIRSDGKAVKVDGFELRQFEKYPGTDPRELFDVLRAAAGAVDTVGTEELHGTQTTHYRATLDPARLAEAASGIADAASTGAATGTSSGSPGLATGADSLAQQLAAQKTPVPVDVWLDAEGRIRKLAIDMTTDGQGSAGAGSVAMSFELWDYGEDVGIALPPADEVVDASSLKP